MFYKAKPSGFTQVRPGIDLKTLVFGEKTHLVEVHLKEGHELPLHAHSHEQTGYMIHGKVRFYIGAEIHEAEPGDSWSIPANLEHRVEVLADSVIIEVFSPLREDYLPYRSD